MPFTPLFLESISIGSYPPGWCVCGHGALIVSGGRKKVCVPACCIVLRYKLHEFIICIDGWQVLTCMVLLSSGLQGTSRVSGCFLLCNLLLFLGCVILVLYYESLWGPMYERCTGVCYSVDLCLYSVWCWFLALSLPLSLFTICLHCVWSLLVITYHSYGSLCYVVTIRAALYLYCGVAIMFLRWGGFSGVTVSRGGGGGAIFMAGGVSARHQRSC